MNAPVENNGYELIAELVELTGLPEREATKLLLTIIKKANIEPHKIDLPELRKALSSYLIELHSSE